MSTWTATAQESGGTIMGDGDTGRGWLVEYKSDELPTARATTYYHVVDLRERDSDREGEERLYVVSEMTEYIIFTDPEDIGGSETWSDYDYSGDGSYLSYESEDRALEEAQRLAEVEAGNHNSMTTLYWDGTPIRR